MRGSDPASAPTRASATTAGTEPNAGPEPKRRAPAIFAPATASDVTPEKPAPIAAPKSWWIDWATLLWRVYDVDALQCPCGGRLRFVEVVDDPKAAAVVLRALGLPAEPPHVARARDPTPDVDSSPPDTHVDVSHPDDLDPTSWPPDPLFMPPSPSRK